MKHVSVTSETNTETETEYRSGIEIRSKTDISPGNLSEIGVVVGLEPDLEQFLDALEEGLGLLDGLARRLGAHHGHGASRARFGLGRC